MIKLRVRKSIKLEMPNLLTKIKKDIILFIGIEVKNY